MVSTAYIFIRSTLRPLLWGLFTLHALFKHPYLFDCYVASSPSIWWNSQCILQEARLFLKNKDKENRSDSVGRMSPTLMVFFESWEQDAPWWHNEPLKQYKARKQVTVDMRMVDNVIELCQVLQESNQLHAVSLHPFNSEEHAGVMACLMNWSLTRFFKEWHLSRT